MNKLEEGAVVNIQSSFLYIRVILSLVEFFPFLSGPGIDHEVSVTGERV